VNLWSNKVSQWGWNLPREILWLDKSRVVIKIVAETRIKELLLPERTRTACEMKSIPPCPGAIRMEMFTASNIFFLV